ncbi:HYR domain-containing protein [Salinimicrobium sp. TH3]|uniref:HYR domain-containing protein n=1 Tax=Salinimicrobium sp. TH3 TaxID=2997342 RepID=UPI002274601C|nr:HYR domain-containing protein [Salinimicrobium sp. TH3]MCY2687722.1 HYR domain-containing protein [Salinimicrobium sp. TH3]
MRRLQTFQKCNSTAVLLRHFFGCRGRFFVILSLILLITSFPLLGQNPADEVPSYNHEGVTSLNGISLTNLNPDNLTIAVATGPENKVYTLSFGSGVDLRNVKGEIVVEDFIPSAQLDGPLDLAVDDEGFIYITDYLAEGNFARHGKIKVFDSDGNLNRIIPLGFYRPMGIDVNQKNIYLAEYYDGNQGPEQGSQFSRISVYDKETDIRILKNEIDVEVPYRIAVNSKGILYVSEAGNDDPAVLIFDQNLSFKGRLSNVQSPGSLLVDKFDYLHVIEYAGRLNFGQLLNFSEIGIDEAIDFTHRVFDGIEENAFGIKVFDPSQSYEYSYKQKIDFPVDIAFSSCDKMYLLNLDIIELYHYDNWIGHEFLPSALEMDLEIYKRTPTFDSFEGPELTCPADIVVTAEPGDNFAEVEFEGATATDNCSATVVQTIGDPSGSEFSVGKHTIEYTATDGFGNQATCTFTITVNPSASPVPPEATCNSFPISLDENGVAQITAEQVYGGNEVGLDLEVNISSFDCSKLGENTVILTVTDPTTGLSDFCPATIKVIDNSPPVVSCVAPFSVTLNQGGNASITVDEVDNGSVDNCTITNKVLSQYNFTTADIGEVPVTLTVTDEAGLTAQCTVKVTVEDSVSPDPPEAICNSFIVSLDENGMAQITAEQVYGGNDGNLDLEIDTTSFDCSKLGDNTVILTVTDPTTGLSDSCPATITVKDEIFPTITCPSNIVENVAIGETGKVINYSAPYGDNCSGATVNQTAGLPSGSVFPVGETTTNTFVVTDAVGNTATCSFTVTINEAEDEEDPVISCPPNIEILTDPRACGAIVTFETPTPTDNSGSATVTKLSGPDSGDFLAPGSYEVIFEARDSSDNTATCTLKITVKDEEPPQFTICPQNSTQFVGAVNGKYFVPDLLEEVEAVDNCGNPVRYEQTPVANEEITQDVTVNIRAFDGQDNESDVCSIELVLVQEDQPSFDCGSTAGLSLELDEDCNYIVQDFRSYVNNRQNFDDGIFIEQTEERLGEELQVNLKVYHGTDANAPFVGECNLVVTLEDNISPEINSCNNSPVEVDLLPGENFVVPDYKDRITYSDNCSTQLNVIQVPAPQDVITNNTTVTLTVEDEAGNISTTCSFPIVYNTPAVEINCVSTQVALGPNGTATLDPATLYDADPTNPAVAFFDLSKDVFTCENIGEQEVELIVHFVDGSSGSCTTKIEVIDQLKPVISCREDFNLYLNEDGYGIIPPEMLLESFSDNCGIQSVTLDQDRFETADAGEQDVVVTVVDVNGNFETCETTINVVPYDPMRSVDCVESKTLFLDENGYAELRLFYTGEEDNIELELNKKDFTCDDIGPPQMITASYQGEHTGSCEIEILVVDDLPPLVNCISEIDLVLDENGTGEISVNDVDQNSTDNCAIEDMSLSKSNFTSSDVGTQTVRFTVTDASGNSDFCEVTVNVKPYMATTGELDCVENLTLELDAGGEAVLTAQDLYEGDPGTAQFFGDVTYTCEDIGVHTITLTKKDDPSQSCEIEVEIVDNIAPVASCKADMELTLDINGTATLAPEDVDSGSTDNCEIAAMSLDRTSFTAADLGEQKVTLTVRDASGNTDTCETTIMILPNEENPSGVVCRDLITLDLDVSGRAQLNPQEAFSSGPSGTYTLSQTNFTCDDLGENEVTLSYTTLNGNGSCVVKVVVEDPLEICEAPGPVERDTLILYPNPGDGLFKFEVSEGLQIHQIEVFDIRGRFLLEHRYDNSVPILEYSINLSEYQAGVYQLLIQTNGREYLKRAIIR